MTRTTSGEMKLRSSATTMLAVRSSDMSSRPRARELPREEGIIVLAGVVATSGGRAGDVGVANDFI